MQLTLFSEPAKILPAKKIGRPSQYLTGPELNEAINYYLVNDSQEKQRLLLKFGWKRLRHAVAICKLDMGRHGTIFRTVCPTHGRVALIYNWDNKEGARVRCKAPGCEFNTHFMPFMFNPETFTPQDFSDDEPIEQEKEERDIDVEETEEPEPEITVDPNFSPEEHATILHNRQHKFRFSNV